MSYKAKCPFCKKRVANTATKCPHCTSELSGNKEWERDAKFMRNGQAIITTIVVLFFIYIFFIQ